MLYFSNYQFINPVSVHFFYRESVPLIFVAVACAGKFAGYVQDKTCQCVEVVFFGQTGQGQRLRGIVNVESAVCKPAAVILFY